MGPWMENTSVPETATYDCSSLEFRGPAGVGPAVAVDGFQTTTREWHERPCYDRLPKGLYYQGRLLMERRPVAGYGNARVLYSGWWFELDLPDESVRCRIQRATFPFPNFRIADQPGSDRVAARIEMSSAARSTGNLYGRVSEASLQCAGSHGICKTMRKVRARATPVAPRSEPVWRSNVRGLTLNGD